MKKRKKKIDWPQKYPWRFLPRGGKYPFVPPKGENWLNKPLRGENGGYLDRNGNDWYPHKPAPTREEDFH